MDGAVPDGGDEDGGCGFEVGPCFVGELATGGVLAEASSAIRPEVSMSRESSFGRCGFAETEAPARSRLGSVAVPAVSGIAAPAEPEATGVPFAVTVTVATIGFTVMEIIEDREIRAALGT